MLPVPGGHTSPLACPVVPPARSFTALDALKGWLSDKSGEPQAGLASLWAACTAVLCQSHPGSAAPQRTSSAAALAVLPGSPRPGARGSTCCSLMASALLPLAVPAEPVQVGAAEDWLRSRQQDVQAHAAQTLKYDWSVGGSRSVVQR